MQLFKYIDRINLLDKLIQQRRTGTPQELARRLGVSESRLYVVLDELKLKGAPISYCRQSKSYYYDSLFTISIQVELKGLPPQELTKINGGEHFFKLSFPLLFLSSESG